MGVRAPVCKCVHVNGGVNARVCLCMRVWLLMRMPCLHTCARLLFIAEHCGREKGSADAGAPADGRAGKRAPPRAAKEGGKPPSGRCGCACTSCSLGCRCGCACSFQEGVAYSAGARVSRGVLTLLVLVCRGVCSLCWCSCVEGCAYCAGARVSRGVLTLLVLVCRGGCGLQMPCMQAHVPMSLAPPIACGL